MFISRLLYPIMTTKRNSSWFTENLQKREVWRCFLVGWTTINTVWQTHGHSLSPGDYFLELTVLSPWRILKRNSKYAVCYTPKNCIFSGTECECSWGTQELSSIWSSRTTRRSTSQLENCSTALTTKTVWGSKMRNFFCSVWLTKTKKMKIPCEYLKFLK